MIGNDFSIPLNGKPINIDYGVYYFNDIIGFAR